MSISENSVVQFNAVMRSGLGRDGVELGGEWLSGVGQDEIKWGGVR
jgi:hypothetical protein